MRNEKRYHRALALYFHGITQNLRDSMYHVQQDALAIGPRAILALTRYCCWRVGFSCAVSPPWCGVFPLWLCGGGPPLRFFVARCSLLSWTHRLRLLAAVSQTTGPYRVARAARRAAAPYDTVASTPRTSFQSSGRRLRRRLAVTSSQL